MEELRRRDSAWAAAASAGEDVDLIVSFWTEDAVVIPPGMPPLKGMDAIRDYVAGAFATPGFSITWKTTEFGVAGSGELAYGIGTNRVTIPAEDGALLTIDGRAVALWRKDAGVWRCFVDIWNDAPPPS